MAEDEKTHNFFNYQLETLFLNHSSLLVLGICYACLELQLLNHVSENVWGGTCHLRSLARGANA